jgi:hypothetical protein
MKKQFRDFESARDFVRALELKGHKEWRVHCNSGNKPDDIPANPWNTYKEWNKKRVIRCNAICKYLF